MTKTVTLTLTLSIDDAQAVLDLIADPKPEAPAWPVERDPNVTYRLTLDDDDDDTDDTDEVEPEPTAQMRQDAAEIQAWREAHNFKQSEAAEFFSPYEGRAIPTCSWCYFENPNYHLRMVGPNGEPRRDRRRMDYVLARIRDKKR